MEIKKLRICTDGMKMAAFNEKDEEVFSGGSLRDATEAIEYMVLQAQYANGVGNFNPDKTISAMLTNPDLRSKCEKVIQEAQEG
jgi:hypothetical protein